MIACQEKTEVERVFQNMHANLKNFEETIISSEEQTNMFLDAILETNKLLNKHIDFLHNFVPDMEALTWLDDIDNECIENIKELLIIAGRVRLKLFNLYILVNNSKIRPGLKTTLKEFKSALDDFSEIIKDVNNVFFIFPSMPDFVEVSKQLQEI